MNLNKMEHNKHKKPVYWFSYTIQEQTNAGITDFIYNIIKQELSKSNDERPDILRHLCSYIDYQEELSEKGRTLAGKDCSVCRKKTLFLIKNRCHACYQKLKRRENNVKPEVLVSFDTIRKDIIVDKHVTRTITINLLEGLTEEQIGVIKYYVSKGCHPLGFTVYLDTNEIYYFGQPLTQLANYNWKVK